MVFIEPTGLYHEQVERLERASDDDRMDFEELAGYFEFDCGHHRLQAERSAFCYVNWKKGWAAEHAVYPVAPDFSQQRHHAR